MKKKIIGCLLLGALSAGLKSYAQQNIQFTQYIFNSLSVNPAYAGYKEEWYAQIALRSQWVNLDGAPKTGSLSLDGVLGQDKRHGVGLQILADKFGPQAVNSVYANYAFRIQLDEEDSERLSLGIGLGMSAYSLDGTKLTNQDRNDSALPNTKISNLLPDLKLGVYYYNPNWYAGVSVMDIFSNGTAKNSKLQWDGVTTDNLRARPHVYLIAGALVPLEQGLALRPSILVKDDFKGPTSLDLNALAVFNNRFWVGLGYRTAINVFSRDYVKNSVTNLRNANSVSGIIQVAVNERLRLGYSYDHIVSNLSTVQKGSHEITAGFTFNSIRRNLSNPRFF